MSVANRLLLLLTFVLLSACSNPTALTVPTTAPSSVATPMVLTPLIPTAVPAPAAAPNVPTPVSLSKDIDVGGRTLHMICKGSGSPTVVLDAGLGGSSADWVKVQDPAQQITQVCAYNRAGVGQSPSAPTPRTTQDIVDDLHTLLSNAGITAPYVLVGHSSGGLDVLLYAHQYPKDVVGVVLVDSDHQEMDVRTEQIMPPEKPNDSDGVKGIRQYLTEAKDPNTNPEKIDFQASYAQLRAVTSLGNIPLVVIIAGVQDSFLPDELAPQITALWREMQEDHTLLSSRGRLVVAEQSDHLIPENQPQIIVDAIKEVVEAAR